MIDGFGGLWITMLVHIYNNIRSIDRYIGDIGDDFHAHTIALCVLMMQAF